MTVRNIFSLASLLVSYFLIESICFLYMVFSIYRIFISLSSRIFIALTKTALRSLIWSLNCLEILSYSSMRDLFICTSSYLSDPITFLSLAIPSSRVDYNQQYVTLESSSSMICFFSCLSTCSIFSSSLRSLSACSLRILATVLCIFFSALTTL